MFEDYEDPDPMAEMKAEIKAELKAEFVNVLGDYLHDRLDVKQDTVQQHYNELFLNEIREQTFAMRLLVNTVGIAINKAMHKRKPTD